MRKLSICIIVVLLFTGFAMADEFEPVETPLLETLSDMADGLVADISRELRSGGALYTDGITFNNRPSQLGDLYTSVILAKLSGSDLRNLSLYGDDAQIPEAMNSSVYLLTGDIYKLSNEVYLSLILRKGEDDQIILVSEATLPLEADVAMLLAGGFSGGAAGGGDNYEPNNDASNAYPLELNSSVGDISLQPSGDIDWFYINVVDAQNTFLSIGTTGSLDTVMDFYGPDSPDLLIASNDDGDNGSNALIQASVSVPGTYFIKVAGYGSDETGSYGLFVNSEEYVAEEGEPNNNMSEAEYISGASLSLEKKLFPSGDEDWYKLDFSGMTFGAEDSVRIKTESILDTYMELYQNGSLVLSDDDGGSDGNASVIFSPVTGDEYYIMVRGYSSSTLGDYLLSVETIVLELDSYEPDNSQEEATVIEMNTTQNHTLIMSDDIDWYTFTLNRPNNVNFETFGDMDTYVIMYDNQGSIIQESDDDGTGYNGKISMYLEGGTYYCTVALYSPGGEVTDYSVGLSSN
ncbi:MAG: PPC domain-containing protein [Spirochaetales bacterium]|nr:PPC domain-containing protein [Spirochaetales bacterium]